MAKKRGSSRLAPHDQARRANLAHTKEKPRSFDRGSLFVSKDLSGLYSARRKVIFVVNVPPSTGFPSEVAGFSLKMWDSFRAASPNW